MDSALSVETFDGDLEALEALIARSWGHDYRAAMRLDYSTELLRWNLGEPTGDPELVLGAYDGRRLVGFCARFPRTVAREGKTMRAALGTFLTTDVEYRGRGLARRLVGESVQRLRAKEYSGYFFYLQRGHASGPLYRQFSFPCDVVVNGVRIYFRILDSRALAASWQMGRIQRTALRWMEGGALNHGSRSNVRPFAVADLPVCTRLLNSSTRHAHIARRWEERDVLWRLTGYPKTVALVFEERGTIGGLFSAYITEVLGSRWGTARPRSGSTGRESAGFIDNFVVDGLSAAQIRAFLGSGLLALKEAGCTLAIGPSLSLGDKALFLRSRFMPDVFTPALDLRFARLRDDVEPLSARGRVCLDVR